MMMVRGVRCVRKLQVDFLQLDSRGSQYADIRLTVERLRSVTRLA
jgi:hypothetical protein